MSPGVLLLPTPVSVSILKLNVLEAFDPVDPDLTETLHFSSGNSHCPVPPPPGVCLASFSSSAGTLKFPVFQGPQTGLSRVLYLYSFPDDLTPVML